MLSVVKFLVAVIFFLTFNSASSKTINILILQEYVSSDCRVKLSDVPDGLYQIDLLGEDQSVQFSFSQSDCFDPTVFLTLGQAMIKSGMADRVVLVPIGTLGTGLHDWLMGGRAYEKLKLAMKKANDKKIKFDYVLWDGGLIDAGFSASNYQSDVKKILKEVKLGAKAEKFIISKSVSCKAGSAAQEHTYRWDPLYKRFAGPDIGRISREYYADKCDFTEAGKKKIAQLWLESINKADIEDRGYQKEALLYYFK
jgi:hypothetical protein